LLLIFLQGGLGLLDLLLGAGSGLIHELIASLRRLLAAGFLAFENFLAGFAEALLIFGSAGFGSGYVGARFLHGSLSTAPAFG
jgi:hypothetical protein